jgi:tripartite-type tricarboxylate transporter receptor subunit TctC
MILHRTHLEVFASLLLALLSFQTGALAQQFPAKPIRIIVPTSPGGLNDALSRTLAQQVSESVGQPVVVENRAGAGSMIGMSALAKSPPDGYTVAITTAEALVYNPLFYTRLPYDPDGDFSYVSQLVRNLGVIVAHPSTPGAAFSDVMAYAKSNPGKLNWATWGPGSTPAIYLEWIRRQNAVDITAVPYKGVGPSIPAIVGGQVHLAFMGIASAVPLVQSGKLKALAVTGGASHLSSLPSVPNLAQYNSDPDFVSDFSVYAPAKTPGPILDRLSSEFVKALRTPQLQKFTAGTMVVVGSTPAEFAAALKAKRAEAARLFKALNIQPREAPE